MSELRTTLPLVTDEDSEGISLWQDAFQRLKKNKLAVFGACFILLEIALCIATPWIAPYGFEDQNLELTLAPTSYAHWFGTDTLGRDLLTRVLYGGRISLMVGLLASLVSVIVGVIYGAISGFVGGRLDNIMMRIVDVIYALPFIFLVIILMVYFGRNFVLLFVALGLTQWLTMARIVRGQVMSLKQKEFIEAAHSMGIPGWSIITRHLIPNCLGTRHRLPDADSALDHSRRGFLELSRPGRAGTDGFVGNAHLQRRRGHGSLAGRVDFSRGFAFGDTLLFELLG